MQRYRYGADARVPFCIIDNASNSSRANLFKCCNGQVGLGTMLACPLMAITMFPAALVDAAPHLTHIDFATWWGESCKPHLWRNAHTATYVFFFSAAKSHLFSSKSSARIFQVTVVHQIALQRVLLSERLVTMLISRFFLSFLIHELKSK